MKKEVSWEEIAVGQEFEYCASNNSDVWYKRTKVNSIEYRVGSHGWICPSYIVNNTRLRIKKPISNFLEIAWEDIRIGECFSVNDVDSLDRKKIHSYYYELLNGSAKSDNDDNVFNVDYLKDCTLKMQAKESVTVENKKEGDDMERIVEIKETNKTVSLDSLKIGQRFVFRNNPTCVGLKTDVNTFFLDRYRLVDGVVTCDESERNTISPATNSRGYWADVLPIDSYSFEGDKVVVVAV